MPALKQENITGDTAQNDNVPAAARASENAQPAEKSFAAKSWDYLKSRFDSENWFGSVVLAQNWYTGYSKIRGAMVREVHGMAEPDRLRAFYHSIPLAGYTWSFFSKRGAKFPEGDTVPARMLDALKHPNESSNQFEFLVFAPTNLLGIYNNVEKGLKAHGVGLKPGEKAYAPEKVRLYYGAAITAWQVCTGIGHFRKRRETLLPAEAAPEKPGFIGMLQKVWRHDRVLFIGALLNTSLPCFSAVEGWQKMSASRKEAGYIMRSAIVGIISVAAYNLYIFQRIARSNLNSKSDPPEQKSADDQMTVQDQQAEKTEKKEASPLSFVDKLAAQRIAPPQLALQASL